MPPEQTTPNAPSHAFQALALYTITVTIQAQVLANNTIHAHKLAENGISAAIGVQVRDVAIDVIKAPVTAPPEVQL